MSSPDAEITNAKTGDDNNQPTSPTEVKLNDFDNLPQPDTWLYRNDSLSKAKREVSRRSLADLMNPNAEPTEEVLLAKKKAEDIVKSGGVDTSSGGKLTWFNGVMVPCLLNIWGVIMFLRLTWVVGQAGIILTIAIITLSNLVTTITALSLCAIVTNGEVKGGGAYYLISRALGPTYGGVIGLLFFCAQAVATSMYVIGFSDSIIDISKKSGADPFTGDFANDQRVISTITMVLLLITAYAGGADAYAKCMNFLLGVLVLSMITLFVGVFAPDVPDPLVNTGYGFVGFARQLPQAFLAKLTNTTSSFAKSFDNNDIWLPNYTTDPTTMMSHGFFSVFSVFFPAVTGIMAGANMSGDLKDPSAAIPKGTMRAIVLTYFSYILLAILTGLVSIRCSDIPENVGRCPDVADAAWASKAVADGSIPQGGLLYSKLIMESISVWGPLVYAGVFAATLSSALASIVGAPRILQSVAADGIFPWPLLNYFAKGSGKGNEPLRGYVLSFAVGLGCCLIGQLDVVAPIISNFFMISYAVTNYACFAASMSQSPGWRPSFQYYNKWLSLFGAVLCVVTMFLMDWANSLLSGGVGICIFVYLQNLDPETHWGPAGEARTYVGALRGMEKLQGIRKDHVKTYRPQFLIMCGSPAAARMSLVKFATMMKHGHGVNVYGSVLVDKDDNNESDARDKQRQKMRKVDDARTEMYSFFYENPKVWGKDANNRAFCDVVGAKTLHEGFISLLQLGGLGRLKPNIVLLGYKEGWKDASTESVAEYEALIADSMYHNRGVLILRDRKNSLKNYSSIDKKQRSLSFTGASDSSEYKSVELAPNSPKKIDDDIQDNKGDNDELDEEDDIKIGIDGETSTHRSALNINKANVKKTKRIDIWYLGSDGGLTLLIPWLLQKDPRWKDSSLRVTQLTHTGVDGGDTVRLSASMSKLMHLLRKIRIVADTNMIDASLAEWPMEKTIKEYKQLCEKVNLDHGIPDRADSGKAAPDLKTIRILRLTEQLREHSFDADLIYIQLPIPENTLDEKRYMSYLEILSNKLPMVCFIRGNNENVMTIYA